MNNAVLGLDTSNYRTSLALVSAEGMLLFHRRMLLPVAKGDCGLRQSEAVYAHLKQIKAMSEPLREACAGRRIAAVCASVKPRDRAESYMPVFEVGDTIGRLTAGVMGIPFFPTDHQHGHIRAAAYGTELAGKDRYLAFHLSGGTTDLLAADGDQLTELGTSLDLHAGQLVDRAGVGLGCSFPAGPELEQLALKGSCSGKLGCALEQGDLYCHLSGAESQVARWIQRGEMPPGNIAREVYDLLSRTAARMLLAGAERTGFREALLFGGIASSGLFRVMLQERMNRRKGHPRLVFGNQELCGDNAVGVALIGADRLRKNGYSQEG